MIPREGEPTRFSDVPWISTKTSNKDLREWSTNRWKSGTSNYVASDIVNNGKELLLGSDIDWSLVLGSISVAREFNSRGAQFGEDAIAINGARFIGGLAARAGWSMHDPQSAYLSGRYLAHIVGSKLEGFKTTMTKRAVSYGQKTLPDAELLMKTVDLLLEHRDRRNHSNLITKIGELLHDGKIQRAYDAMVSSRDDFVRRRGPDFVRSTKSSILTPPNPGM